MASKPKPRAKLTDKAPEPVRKIDPLSLSLMGDEYEERMTAYRKCMDEDRPWVNWEQQKRRR